MQTCKIISAIGVAALLAGVTTTLAQSESDAQARAREALRQKMAELDAQGSNKPAPRAPVIPPAPVAPPVVVTPPPAPVVVAPRVSDTPTPPPVPPAPVVVAPRVSDTPPAPEVRPPAVVVAPRVADAPPRVDAESTDRARAALREKMSQLDAQGSVGVVTPSGRAYTPPTVPKNNVAVSVPPPAALQPPPSALPAGKEAKLAELLSRYRADAITPEQYHTQRAAIIAGP